MAPELIVLLALVGLALLSMLVYRFTPGGRGGADRTGRGGSFVLGFWVRNWFYWALRPIRAAALGSGLSPYAFNALGVLFGLGALAGFGSGHLALGGWALLLSGIADVLDGEIARARNLVSPAGAFLDSTLDRYAELAAFAGLALFFGGGLSVFLVVIALGGSLLVSYTRARGESVGVLCKAGIMQRAERMLLLGFGGILDGTVSRALGRPDGRLLLGIVALLAVTTLGTSIYRSWWITRELQRR